MVTGASRLASRLTCESPNRSKLILSFSGRSLLFTPDHCWTTMQDLSWHSFRHSLGMQMSQPANAALKAKYGFEPQLYPCSARILLQLDFSHRNLSAQGCSEDEFCSSVISCGVLPMFKYEYNSWPRAVPAEDLCMLNALTWAKKPFRLLLAISSLFHNNAMNCCWVSFQPFSW